MKKAKAGRANRCVAKTWKNIQIYSSLSIDIWQNRL